MNEEAGTIDFALVSALRQSKKDVLQIQSNTNEGIEKLASLNLLDLSDAEIVCAVRNFGALKEMSAVVSSILDTAIALECEKLGRKLSPLEARQIVETHIPSATTVKLV